MPVLEAIKAATYTSARSLLIDSEVGSIEIGKKPDIIISVYAARPLELAVDTATQHLMAWLIDEYGMSPTDAYCLVSTCPDFRINIYQMVNMGKLSFVAGAEVTKSILS